MSMEILINRININLNHEAICRDFDIWKISTDLFGKQNYGKTINKIYKTFKPMSLCNLGKGSYAVLVSKGRKHHLNDAHFVATTIQPGDLGKASCSKLLLGALPQLTNDHTRSSEGVGLYYLSDIEIIRKIEVLRTFEIKLEWEQKQHLVLKVEAATFTPVSYHTNADGNLYGDCTHLPRVTFDRWAQELTRSSGGEFIKKKHRDKNMSSELLSLDTKNPSKFWRSKMGILAIFMDDVQRYLKSYISIDFQPLSSMYRTRFKDVDIKKTYEAINNLLIQKEINLINLTDTDVSPLISVMKEEGLNVIQSRDVRPNSLNFAIHHDKEYYELASQIDPYNQLRVEDAIIQSVYPGTIFKEGKLSKTEYEACKKEIFIKWEAVDRQLKLIVPEGNWLFVICNEKKDAEFVFNTLSCNQGILAFEVLSMDTAQDKFLLDLPRTMVDGDHAVINLDTKDTYIFEETNYVALPQFYDLARVMNELADGYAMGIQRIWIDEFLELLKKGDIILPNRELVETKLSSLLTLNPSIEKFYKKEIFSNSENKIAYKGSFQVFFDWIAAEKGLRLGASLKAQDSGYIEAALGLFYNEEENLYFVGDKDNVKSVPRFCRMRRVLTDAEIVPVELLKMMEVFHIRHKQATIYPFPFKHLRELVRLNALKV